MIMALDTPGWWYPDGSRSAICATVLPWLLSPASALYGAVAQTRMSRAPSYVSSLPVICVGNFTAGGTGKTPLSIDLAGRLRKLGAVPAFLTRGHGGKIQGPYDVNVDRDTADRTGDESLLLARVAPTVICRDRVLGAKHIERSDATVIIMDDGMQNPALGKTLTIAVVDGMRGLGNGWTMPSGPLRAPLDRQVKRVDAIVMNGSTMNGRESALAHFSGPFLSGKLLPGSRSLGFLETPVVAFSGIGNPSRFYRTLEQCGADVRGTISFPDHHAFGDGDAERILKLAEREQAAIVTTEKDRVRLIGVREGSERAVLRERSYALPVSFTFTDADDARLDALLDMLLRQARRS